MPLKLNKLCIAILFLWVWDGILYAQDRAMHMSRIKLVNSEIHSSNPSLLQIINDSLLLDVNTYYQYGTGDFINYFSPKQYYDVRTSTQSYNRLSKKTVVYGLASYKFYKGKKSSGSAFLHPYRMPFNFIENEESAKGNRQIEQYHLIGAFSYQAFNKVAIGAKIDYKTVSFAKLKDMRNTNNILDLKINAGLSYQLTNHIKLGLSYVYFRYIENLKVSQKGKANIDHWSLLDRGTFIGSLDVFGGNGLRETDSYKPWVDLTNSLALQGTYRFSNSSKWFSELVYQKTKGHYGNDGDNSEVYMRHHQDKYLFNTHLNILRTKASHIILASGSFSDLKNNEQLFKSQTTSGGVTVLYHYGERESINRQNYTTNISYQILWGDNYLKAPWRLMIAYKYNNIVRHSSYYPYFRKQDISWSEFDFQIANTIRNKKTNITLSFGCKYSAGKGGDPQDGVYVVSSGSTSPPDNLNNLLYKEKEYLTARQLLSAASLRTDYEYNNKMDIYLLIKGFYLKPFNLDYLDGDFMSLSISAGLSF